MLRATSSLLDQNFQMEIFPLFKPAALSMWPPLMPLLQYVYWMQVGQGNSGPKAYLGKVSPGKQQFRLNVMALVHIDLMSVVLLVFVLAAIPFLPLTLILKAGDDGGGVSCHTHISVGGHHRSLFNFHEFILFPI